ncbi:MAG TPA: glycosyltransferase family 4 protein [Bacteroidales bacterium]|nr:glycosyltransferase family 4 protein [Bacteroidales bacterium]
MEQPARPSVLIFQESLPDYRLPFLNALGEEVELRVCYSGATELKDVRPDAGLIQNFRAVEMPRKGPSSGLWSWHPALFAQLRAHRPAVVIAEPRLGLLTSWALAWRQRHGFRLVWWMSGHEPPESGLRNRLRRFLRKALYRRADTCIGYGSHTRSYLEALGLDLPVFIAPNAADSSGIARATETWMKEEALQEHSRSLRAGAAVILLFVGRMIEAKRLPVLLKALSLALNRGWEDWRLLLVGDGPDRSQLENQAHALGLQDRVTFCGSVHGPDKLVSFFRAADLFVLPGKGGLALNEAISFGLPVLLSSADGTEADMVEQGCNGIILAESGPEAFAQAIPTLAQDMAALRRMGEASLRIAAQRSNLHLMVRGFLEAILHNSVANNTGA